MTGGVFVLAFLAGLAVLVTAGVLVMVTVERRSPTSAYNRRRARDAMARAAARSRSQQQRTETRPPPDSTDRGDGWRSWPY